MVAQVVAPVVVKYIFTEAVRRLFGSRQGLPIERNPLFGPIAEAIVNRPTGTGNEIPSTPAPPREGTRPPPPNKPPRGATTPPFIPVPVIPGVPGSPGGPSIPDRIPPRTIPAAGVLGSVLARVVGWGAGALFYPRSTSSADTVCIETQYGPWCPPGMPAVPAPVAVPGARPGRRSRPRIGTASPPRRRERPRTLPPPAVPLPRPRGRPITISQPIVRPVPRVVTSNFPQPRSLPPPATTFPTPGNVGAPSVPAARANPLLQALPLLGAFLIPSIGSWVNTGTRAIPRTGTPSVPAYPPGTLPGVGPIPGMGPQPLPQLAPQALTSYQTAPAQSLAQDLDRQCRERAKQKRKRKKPKERDVCYRGTFYELKKGTRKQRKEKIKCQ